MLSGPAGLNDIYLLRRVCCTGKAARSHHRHTVERPTARAGQGEAMRGCACSISFRCLLTVLNDRRSRSALARSKRQVACALQFVFAWTTPSQRLDASRLFRSDSYGKAGSWVDITGNLLGTPQPKTGTSTDCQDCVCPGKVLPLVTHLKLRLISLSHLCCSLLPACAFCWTSLTQSAYSLHSISASQLGGKAQADAQAATLAAASGCKPTMSACGVYPGSAPPGQKQVIGIREITMHPSSPGRMLLQGLGFHHWVSNDYGKTFQVSHVIFPGRIQ